MLRNLLTIAEDELAPPLRADWRFDGFLEPDMILATVVGHNIDDDLDTDLFQLGGHLVKILEGTDSRVDVSVVGNVICS